jgi:shikimate dehydrogenase
MPHKEYIIPFIDEMTEDAKLYNSVNCVKNINGKLIGHNTDSSGVLMSLEDMGINIKDEKVIVLGGGGAAKALSIGLSKAGAKEVVVINRTLKKAQDICTCGNMRACGLTMENLKNELRESVLMINGTPMGMKGGNAQFDGFSFLDETKAFIYDTVYYPRRTRLLEEAGKRGLRAASGLTMLVYQGLFAYEFFFNEKIDIKKEAAWLINKI